MGKYGLTCGRVFLLSFVKRAKIAIFRGALKRGQLSFYLAFLFTRGPAVRDGIHEIYAGIVQRNLACLFESGALSDDTMILQDLVRKHSLFQTIRTDIFADVSLLHMIKMAAIVGSNMLRKTWTFYTPCRNMHFVTSDNPVSYCLQRGFSSESIGPAHPFSAITIPLRKDLALIVSPSTNMSIGGKDENECTILTANKTMVNAINRRTAAAALKFIYSSENSPMVLNLVQGVMGTSQRMATDIVEKGTWRAVENPYKP
jgi:hypothetical protein